MSNEDRATQEQLLGYLLGALDEGETRAVREAIASDPRLATEAAQLDTQLAVLGAEDEPYEPPVGLAARTMANIPFGPSPSGRGGGEGSEESSSLQGRGAGDGFDDRPFLAETVEEAAAHAAAAEAEVDGLPTPAISPRLEPLSGGRWWRWSDIVVAAGVCAAAAVLFFPAIASSRHRASITACQNNLMNLGVALTSFTERGDGHFPQVPTEGNAAFAGVYAPLLKQAGYLEEDNAVLCPGSDQAKDSRNEFRVVSLSDIEAASGRELKQLQRLAGGSYGYAFGHIDDDGKYQPNVNRRRPHFAIAADAPSVHLADRQSANHGGCGQNVLYEDGHVAYLTCGRGEDCSDHVFTSDRGYVEAGRHFNDAVVADSAAAPILPRSR